MQTLLENVADVPKETEEQIVARINKLAKQLPKSRNKDFLLKVIDKLNEDLKYVRFFNYLAK